MTEERKSHRPSHCLRTEPESTEVLAREKSVVEAFKKVGCWKFCKKIAGRKYSGDKGVCTTFH